MWIRRGFVCKNTNEKISLIRAIGALKMESCQASIAKVKELFGFVILAGCREVDRGNLADVNLEMQWR